MRMKKKIIKTSKTEEAYYWRCPNYILGIKKRNVNTFPMCTHR